MYTTNKAKPEDQRRKEMKKGRGLGEVSRRRRRRVVASPSADTATRRSAEEESRGRPEGRGGLAGLRGGCGRLRRVHHPKLLEVRRAGRDFVSGSGSGSRAHCATANQYLAITVRYVCNQRTFACENRHQMRWRSRRATPAMRVG
jgi:hypothetical protein